MTPWTLRAAILGALVGASLLGVAALGHPSLAPAAPLAQATATPTNTLTPTVTSTPTSTATPTRTPTPTPTVNPSDAVMHFVGAEAIPFRAVHNGDGTYSLSVVVVTPVP